MKFDWRALWFLFLIFCLFQPEIVRSADNSAVKYSPSEQKWLDQKHIVRANLSDYAPIQLYDEKPAGIAVAYLNKIAEKAGFEVKYVYGNVWKEALKKIKSHTDVDLLLGAMKTKERMKYLAFTEPYLSFPSVIFTKDSADFLSSLTDLTGKSVSVVNQVVVHKLLVQNYPEIKIVPFKRQEETLKALFDGKVDAAVGNLTVGSYYIRSNSWDNIKIAAPTGFASQDLSMAVRNDWPELASIIDKSITT